MTDLAAWQTANDAFLADRLADLRLRLGRLAGDDLPKSAIAGTESTAASVDRGAEAVSDSQPLAALEILAGRLGMSSFEQDVLMLCAGLELDTRIASLCARAQGDASRPYPTFALALALFDDPVWDALSPDRPLRAYRLIEMNQPGATPLTAAALRADERIVNYLKGLNSLDDRLAPLMLPFEAGGAMLLSPSQQKVADEIVALIEESVGPRAARERLPLVQLSGSDSTSKQLVAQRVAAAFGLDLLRQPIDAVPSDLAELETLLRLWERESRLLPIGLYIDASEAEARGTERPSGPHLRFLARAAGLVFVDSPEARPAVGRASITFDIAKPTPAEQRELWQELLAPSLGADAIEAAARLSGQFSLNPVALHRIAEAATTRSDARINSLWSACRRACRPRLYTLARRIDARATWDDLVLPDDETQQLHAIADQVRYRGVVYDDWGFRQKHNRGLGVSVLFAGESGTGKTMAAEVIANDLQLDLFRIDLSSVVNKYIGETEKNLRKLFDAADDGGAILFFDEADSLFGKRTEIKDSHDRYANLEVNFLLQRMEAYRGLAILATNMKSALDQAFLRRLRFVVNFPIPDAAQRRTMWQKAFPAETPLSHLDYDHLSRLNVTGGNIHTIAVNAAFASAGEAALGMSHVLKAARSEYRKLQKPLNAVEFRGLELEGVGR